MFFREQTTESLNKAIEDFEKRTFNAKIIRDHALRFDINIFKTNILDFVESKYNKYNN
jgi:hypothetical protein